MNAAIQPAKHILLEPKVIYHPVMDILRETHPSFVHHNLDGHAFSTFDHLVNTGILSAKKTPADGEVNQDLLITCHIPSNFSGQRLIYQMITSVASRTWFQSFGRVRMLLWCDEGERQRFIPRTLTRRGTSAFTTEVLVDCQELVGGPEKTNKNKHPPHEGSPRPP